MGAPMLAALRAAGFDATGFDTRPLSDFGEDAGWITDNPAIFAKRLKVLITVVRDIAQTEEVLFKDQNLVEQAQGLEAILVCSTLSPRYVTGLRQRIPSHIALIDAPMSGAQVAAQQRQLSFMLGGTAADLDRYQPLLDAMGTHFHRMGAFGAGMQAKVLNNLLAASHTAMTRLVLDWGDAAGLEESTLLALIATSSGQNWFASGFEQIEFARDGNAADNTIAILVKDVESALDSAPRDANTDLPRLVQSTIAALHPRPHRR